MKSLITKNILSEQALYFGDITPINVFITQELLKCHAYMYCKKETTYKFNSFVCTLNHKVNAKRPVCTVTIL